MSKSVTVAEGVEVSVNVGVLVGADVAVDVGMACWGSLVEVGARGRSVGLE